MKSVIISLILLISAVAFAQNDRDFIEKQLYPAVGLLYTMDSQGGMNMHCTVTAIERNGDETTFATASHCMCEDGSSIDKTAFFVTSDGETNKVFLSAQPIACGNQEKGQDFGVLRVKTTDFPVVPLGKDVTTHSGESIINVASPLGLGKQTFRGTVSSPKLARPFFYPLQHMNWQEAMMIQLPGTNGGSSGSAVVCLEQKAICGFLVGRIDGTETVAMPVSRFVAWYNDVKSGKFKQHE